MFWNDCDWIIISFLYIYIMNDTNASPVLSQKTILIKYFTTFGVNNYVYSDQN